MDTLKPVYIGVTIDSVTQKINIVATGLRLVRVINATAKRGNDATYSKVFNAIDKMFPQDLYNWFTSCGIVPSEAKKLMKEFADRIKDLYNL